MIGMVEGFSSVFRKAIGTRLAAGADSMFDMFTNDAVVEFPFAPPNVPKRLGKPEVVEYINNIAGQFTFDRFGEPSVQKTADPDLVIVEFEIIGRNNVTGEAYHSYFVSLIRTQGGYIIHYREYQNALALLQAVRGSEAINALFNGGS